MLGLLRIPIPEQDQQLACGEARAGVLRLGPPGEAALREALRTQPEALAIIAQDLERGAGAVPEDIERATEGIVARARGGRRQRAHQSLCGNRQARWPAKMRLCGVSWSIRASPKRSAPVCHSGSCGSWAVHSQPCAIGAVEFDLVPEGERPDGGGGHFHKAWGAVEAGSSSVRRDGPYSAFSTPLHSRVIAWPRG